MESINKVTLNGVEYAITDKQAQQLAAILSERITGVETTTERLDTEVAELRAELKQMREDIDNPALYWIEIR